MRSVTVAASLPTVPVGPFTVADATRDEVVESLIDAAARRVRFQRGGAVLAFALHVGGLNNRRNPGLVDAMRSADLVYADGGSVVWLARRAGAATVERSATTDIGWLVLEGLRERLGRTPRVAMIGGRGGLTERAAEVFELTGAAEAVACFSGYEEDWGSVLEQVRAARPDVCLVGMGAPVEMSWCQEWRDELPRTLVMTCGGWFGHVVGDESRAPVPLRRSGLEWIARVAQQPRRLGPRYARGVVSTLQVAREMDRRAN
jgi:N-acetylglucosaminyldiphosphoundecaprenol N-acetyl-beta-D-mannosaminyltransferase